MFCSRCGRTIRPEWERCAHCNMEVGEKDTRFDGFTPYTSLQKRLTPTITLKQEEMDDSWNYTRTIYTGGDYDEPEYDEEAAGTSYRPVFEEELMSPDVRAGMARHMMELEKRRAAEEAAARGEAIPENEMEPIDEPEPEDMPADGFATDSGSESEIDLSKVNLENLENELEDFDFAQLKSRPIVVNKRPALSSEVEEYVRRVEQGEMEEKPARRRGRHMAEEDAYASAAPEIPAEDNGEAMTEEDDIYDDEPRGGLTGRIVKIVAVIAVVAALFVAGIYVAPGLIEKFKREAAAPIEGVTLALYDSGLELIKSRGSEEYKNEVLTTFQNGGFMALTTRLDSDTAAFNALLPETPSVNDQLFIDAVSALQGDIGNAITLDAVEISASGSVTSEESAQRWTTISEALISFEQISSAAGLSAVVSGERIIADLSTPTPTIAPQASVAPEYKTLAKKDEGEEVQKLQERLWELGYLEDDRDGKFGNNTQTAVKLFQQDAGIEVTGIADNETQVLLYSDEAPMTDKAKITPAPEATPEPAPEPTAESAVEPSAEPVQDETPVDAI